MPTLDKDDLIAALQSEEQQGRDWFHPTTLTVVCDPEPDLLKRDPPHPAISCGTNRSDALPLGLAAIETVADGPIDRLYLRWATCPSTGCTEDDVKTATVVGWSQGMAYSTVIDVRLRTVPVPVVESTIAWPMFEQFDAPAVERPTIKNAPTEIADRTPYPFCGRAEYGNPPEVVGCFRDAVLAGRPAEMIERVTGIEGGAFLRLYRFAGRGAIVLHGRSEGRWTTQVGIMALSSYPPGWDMP